MAKTLPHTCKHNSPSQDESELLQPEALFRMCSRRFTSHISVSYVTTAISFSAISPDCRGSAKGDCLYILSLDGCNAASSLQQPPVDVFYTSRSLVHPEIYTRFQKISVTFLLLKPLKEAQTVFSFPAPSFAITGEEDQHGILFLTCDFIPTFESFEVEALSEDGVRGTTTEMLAAADMFHVNVRVWAKFGPTYTWHRHTFSFTNKETAQGH